MRISELAREAGVTRETIHFYLREGLLQPAEKRNARVSYFGESHLNRLRLIRAFQQARLPLARIRSQLDAMANMGLPSSRGTEERSIEVVSEFYGMDGDETPLRRDEVAGTAGLTLDELDQLEALGALQPQSGDSGAMYTSADAEAASAVKTILDQGVALEKLRFVQRYTELAEQELAFVIHHLINPALAAGRRGQVSATLANRGLRVLEAYLRRQFRRRTELFPTEVPDLPDPLGDSRPETSTMRSR